MIDKNNYENTFKEFSKNNQVTLDMKSKELELFEKERFHAIKRIGNSKAGIWFGPLLLCIELLVNFEKFEYLPIFKFQVFNIFDKSPMEYLVDYRIGCYLDKLDENVFRWVFYPYNENQEYIDILEYEAKLIKNGHNVSSTIDKILRIKHDANILLDFSKSISIDQVVKQIELLSELDDIEEESLIMIFYLYLYFKKLDKAKDILGKWNSEKRYMLFGPRVEELLENPDMYIEYVNEIKKQKKFSNLKEIEVKE